ncbi:MAG: hypothetical protein LQ351_006528 [Letrouitia transgressa]|nr:MAG: hypothetical protein LQ351_006528 [Letrouitia transgressa]
MQLNRLYAFRQRDDSSFTSHTRLVVGRISKEDEDNDSQPWDFEAYWFDLVKDVTRPLDMIWGGKCETRSRAWTCKEGAKYKFKGEVDLQRFGVIEEVGDEAEALIAENDCYNVATNNCKTFASKLAKRIQAAPAAPPAPGTVTNAQPFDMQVQFP